MQYLYRRLPDRWGLLSCRQKAVLRRICGNEFLRKASVLCPDGLDVNIKYTFMGIGADQIYS